MNCELCSRYIRQGETLHGIRYGTEDKQHNVFLPAQDSAWTVICDDCSQLLLKLIYAKLRTTSINPAIYKTFTQVR